MPLTRRRSGVRTSIEKRPSEGFPWWVRVDETLVTQVKQEPEEGELAASSSTWMARPVELSHTVADAIAALPHFESLNYPTTEEGAGRKARPSSPALKEGGGDPGDDRRQHLPWGQGVWEDEVDGRIGRTTLRTTSETRRPSTISSSSQLHGRPEVAAATKRQSRTNQAERPPASWGSTTSPSRTASTATPHFASR